MGQVIKSETTKEVVTTPVSEIHTPTAHSKKRVIFRAYQFIWYILGVIETLLAFRVFFKLFAANPYSGFVNLVYAITYPLAAPFFGIFRTTASQGSILEWSTLFAMLVYALLAYGLVELLQFLKPVSHEEVEQTIDNP